MTDLGINTLRRVGEAFPEADLDEGKRTLKVRRLGFLVTIWAEPEQDGRALLRQSFPICRFSAEPEPQHRAIVSADGTFRIISSTTIDGRTVNNRMSVFATSDDDFAYRLLTYATVVEPCLALSRARIFRDVFDVEVLGRPSDDVDLDQVESEITPLLDSLIPHRPLPAWPGDAFQGIESVLDAAGLESQMVDGALETVIPNLYGMGNGLVNDDDSGAMRFRAIPRLSSRGIQSMEIHLDLPFYPRGSDSRTRSGQLWPVDLNAREWHASDSDFHGTWAVPFQADGVPYFVFATSLRLGDRSMFARVTERMLTRAAWAGSLLFQTRGLDDFQEHWANRPMD